MNRHNALGRLGADGERAPSSDAQAAVIGRKLQLKTDAALVPLSTQLIAARFPGESREWVVTVMQPTKPNGVTPWISTFDGDAVYPPVAPHVFTAPQLPLTAGAVGTMQIALRWGAGGIMFETVFDYPACGGVFGLTADTVDVDVRMKDGSVAFASIDVVPVVGAFMVPGFASDPSPLRWLEGVAAVGVGASRFWAVKPYARRCQISSPDASTALRVSWRDTAGNIVRSEVFNVPAGAPGVDVITEVPAQATLVSVTNLDGAIVANVTLEWRIGLM